MLRSVFIKVIALNILLILGLQTNYHVFYYMLFTLNREALTEAVCEKKTETCKACCYLNKQVQEEAEKSDSFPPQKDKKNEIKIMEYLTHQNKDNKGPIVSDLEYLLSSISYTNQFSSGIFRPPRS
ncbi:MAG: hypothetical protein IAE93_14555 [Ignavibacteria bacterium]|nr:hypothetical protein [Ignavibacteria bacterium]